MKVYIVSLRKLSGARELFAYSHCEKAQEKILELFKEHNMALSSEDPEIISHLDRNGDICLVEFFFKNRQKPYNYISIYVDCLKVDKTKPSKIAKLLFGRKPLPNPITETEVQK